MALPWEKVTDNVIHCCITLQLRYSVIYLWVGTSQTHDQIRAPIRSYTCAQPHSALAECSSVKNRMEIKAKLLLLLAPHVGNNLSGSTKDYQRDNHSATY